MRVDVNALLGAYPWRRVPGSSPEALRAAMDRTGIDEAWVSHLPSFFWRAPEEGNAWLYEATGRDRRLKPIPAVHPGRKGWEETIGEAADRGAPAVRCDPTYYGLDPAGAEMRVLAAACAAARLPLVLAVRLEDGRQRHPNDTAPELPAAAVRALIRTDDDVRIIVTHADRGLIEEVHFGSTPEEAARLWWDISWIWGPPEDHREALLATVGVEPLVVETWRAALPQKVVIAGATSLEVAREARAWGADALLAFPRRDDSVAYHAALGEELPVIAFYLYEAAGGVPYDDATVHAILELPGVIGIKVATLDSVITFQRIAAIAGEHADKLLITGEDRFLGYSLMMGARAALVGMGAALTDLQVRLLRAFAERDLDTFLGLTSLLDGFASTTFASPVEGYVRRMLWALAADGVIPDDACDDPWGPALGAPDRVRVARAVRDARAARP